MTDEKELAREIIEIKLQMAVKDLEITHCKKMCADAWTQVNQLRADYVIAIEALQHIAERNFIPPSMAADVAVDALYRIGQMDK